MKRLGIVGEASVTNNGKHTRLHYWLCMEY